MSELTREMGGRDFKTHRHPQNDGGFLLMTSELLIRITVGGEVS